MRAMFIFYLVEKFHAMNKKDILLMSRIKDAKYFPTMFTLLFYDLLIQNFNNCKRICLSTRNNYECEQKRIMHSKKAF